MKIVKNFIQLIIILMICECFWPAFISIPSRDSNHVSIDTKSFSSCLFTYLLSETEEEKYEEDRKVGQIEIADLAKITSFLSLLHTPHQRFIVYGHRDDHHPSWIKLFRVFRI